MIATWYVEAGKYNVLPIDSRGTMRLADERPTIGAARTQYRFYPNTSGVANNIAPQLLNRPHTITAKATIINGSEGVLVAQGGSTGGYSLYVKDHRLHYAYNYLGVEQFHIASKTPLPEGEHELTFQFQPTAPPDLAHGKGTPGKAELYIDGKLAGQGELPLTIPLLIGLSDGLTCGRDDGSTVTDAYKAPFEFTGKLVHVDFAIAGDLVDDAEAKMRSIMAHQ